MVGNRAGAGHSAAFGPWLAKIRSRAASVLGLLLLSSTIVIAAEGTLQPPARYNHPFHGRTVLVYDEWRPYTWGHAWVGNGYGTCVIHLRPVGTAFPGTQVLTKRNMQLLINHERGHCNGWPSWHPK